MTMAPGKRHKPKRSGPSRLSWMGWRHMRLRAHLLVISLAASMAGCGATLDPSGSLGGLATGTLQLPKIVMPIPSGFGGPVGSATDVYSRIARGVLTCWLGANGPLKSTHLFHAVSQPERLGGLSQIVLYQKAKGKERKRGARAATVTIEPFGSSATVSFENLRLDDRLAERFNANVHSWAADNEGCAPKGINEGWETVAPSNGQPQPVVNKPR
ncbi:MAG: hypothetical protein AAFV45_09735 [Pseudomonadota bacterium]